MSHFALNLKRLMARQGLSHLEVAEVSGVSPRTVQSILSGSNAKPHARSLQRLAQGLGVSTDELFCNPARWAEPSFDRCTNPQVDEVVKSRPELFDGWLTEDFDELYSRFGAGGALTIDGALSVVEQMNERRELMRKVALILESDQRQVLSGIVEVLFEQVEVRGEVHSA